MKKGFLLLFKICAFVISPILVKSQVAENFYIPNDSVNVIINKESLQPFFDKLKLLKTESKKVNILHLGDSHIQMGYFVEEMRNQFSKTFGLSGIGTIFPYHIAKYRPFYVSSRVISGNWEGKNHLNKEDDYKYGLCGFTLKTFDKKASFELTSLRNNNQIQTGNQCVIYYEGDELTQIQVQGINTYADTSSVFSSVNIQSSHDDTSKHNWKKLVCYFDTPVNKIRITINQSNSGLPFYIYAIQLTNTNQSGIVYNNCGVGGAQFSSLCKNTSYSTSQIKDLNPDLIILSYGSNESYTTSFKYDEYFEMIKNYLVKVKEAVPNTTIILTTPPDTRSKDRFPRNTDSICIALRALATSLNVSCWDLREQMGGSGSLYKWLKLGLASKDKLHFTRNGYELQAKLFSRAMFNAYNEMVESKYNIESPILTSSSKISENNDKK